MTRFIPAAITSVEHAMLSRLWKKIWRTWSRGGASEGCGVVVVMIGVPSRAAFVVVALGFACSVQQMY
jgi:hypothetical protein